MRTLSLLPLLVLSACEEIEPFLPTVSFNRMEVEEIDFEDAQIGFVFDVNNPNPVEIGLSSFSYDLGLMGESFIAGDNADGFALESFGGSELNLPVSLTWADAWDAVQATRGADFVLYALGGSFGFDSPIGEILLPYQEGGDFPALRTPKFRLANLKVKRLDVLAGTATLNLLVGVNNDHGSTLFFNDFDYTLALGGRQVANGVIPDFAEVVGASEEVVAIPVEVNLVSAGTAVYNALAGNSRLNVDLVADTVVDTPFGVLPLSVDENGDVTVERED